MPLGDWWRLLADSGFAFPQWPEGFGGRGLSGRDAKAVHEARRAVGAYGPPNGVATFLVAPTLLVMGTPEQQQRYLRASSTARPVVPALLRTDRRPDMASLGTRGEGWR